MTGDIRGREGWALKLASSYQKNRSFLLNTSYITLLTIVFLRATVSDLSRKPSNKGEVQKNGEVKKKSPSLSKDELRRLLRSLIPSYKNAAVIHFVLHVGLLVLRAYLTIQVATLDGKLVGALVNKRLKKFASLLGVWMFLGVPSSLVNALISWTKGGLRTALRKNVTDSIIEEYLPDNQDPNYYYLTQDSAQAVADPDQRISTDISRLAVAMSSLPGQLLKPTLDLLLCAKALSRSGVGSGEGALPLGIIAHLSTFVIRFFTPPFAKLAAEKTDLEGQLRSAHSKIVTNSEEIAFLRGHERELDYIDYCYYRLERFLKSEYWKKGIHEVVQTFIVKYFWGAAGLVLCSAPVFINKYLGYGSHHAVAAEFITNRRLLLSASDSLDRLLYSRRHLLQVVGHAARVSAFQAALRGVASKNKLAASQRDNISYSDEITFENVKLVTPADVTLIENLSFSVKHGQHLLIAGPNGSGKSSLFRILGGLWTCNKGQINIPSSKDIFYIPQRAYMSEGSLREQIIYPHSLDDFNKLGKNDEDLEKILQFLQLDALLEESDMNTVKNWSEELSMGLQQLLAIARLYYHRPKFAILDECTSAVSPSMEQLVYKHAQDLGISLVSVAHRSSLWHFHEFILKFDGKGNYYFGPLDAERRLKFEEERISLEKNLRDVPYLRERLHELEKVSNAQHIRYTNSQKNLALLNR